MRRAANVAERRSDKMNVFIFLITGIYLSVMAVIDHRLQKIPVLPGVIGILVIVLARVVDGDFWKWMPGVAVGVFLYLMSKATRGAVGEGDALVDDRSNAWLFWQHRTFDIKFVFFCYCFGVSPCFP